MKVCVVCGREHDRPGELCPQCNNEIVRLLEELNR